MTALAHVAAMLHEEGKKFEKHKDGSLVIAINGELNRAIYPVHLYNSSHGLLRGEVWFPQVREHPILQVEAFCEILNRQWDGVTLGYQEETRRFLLASLIDPEVYVDDLWGVARACDAALPLCIEVGLTGRWDGEIIRLAFMKPKSMGSIH